MKCKIKYNIQYSKAVRAIFLLADIRFRKLNDNLKEIAKMLGFTRDVTKMQFSGKDRIDETHQLCDVIATHSARRTFVVHTLEMGWSPQLVMSYTGHENYETMKPYIAITDKTRKNMMETNF